MTIQELITLIKKGGHFDRLKPWLLNLTVTKAVLLVVLLTAIGTGAVMFFRHHSSASWNMSSLTVQEKEAITITQNFRLFKDGKNVTHVIDALSNYLGMAKILGDMVVVRGWSAEPYTGNAYYVHFYYDDNGVQYDCIFVADVKTKKVALVADPTNTLSNVWPLGIQ